MEAGNGVGLGCKYIAVKNLFCIVLYRSEYGTSTKCPIQYTQYRIPLYNAIEHLVFQTCVVTPSAGLWCVAAASKVVQTQHVSSAPWPVSAPVLDVSIILQRVIRAGLLQNQVEAAVL